MIFYYKNLVCSSKQRGVVLMVVLVLLVVLSMLGYTLSSKVSAQLHRQQYMIDYQAAQYARDSAVKYALTALTDVNEPNLIARPSVPDFSDMFLMTETELREVLSDWAGRMSAEQARKHMKLRMDLSAGANGLNDVNNINDINDLTMLETAGVDFNDANLLEIPGPYGAKWPLITPAVEFKVGTASVTIELHDENAKYPLGWAMLDEPEIRREAKAGFDTFCEWMDVNLIHVTELEDQLTQLNERKRYRLNFEEIKLVKKERVEIPRTARSRRTRRGRSQVRTRTKTTVTKIPATVHLTDFARLFNSSLVDTEILARPTIISEDRKESALRYIGLWGSNKVNVNSAPRQVLETAFVFGGDAQAIAQEIIERRRIEPFKDVNDLKRSLFRYSDSIEKCKDFIVTNSDFFTIRVTAISGVAKASAVVAVRRTGKKYEKIAVLAG
jgi:hypothetical protein